MKSEPSLNYIATAEEPEMFQKQANSNASIKCSY